MFGLSLALPAVLRSFGIPARDYRAAEVEPVQSREVEEEEPVVRRRRDDEDVEPLVLLVAAAWGASQFDVFTR